MKDELISRVMDEVMKKMGASTRLPHRRVLRQWQRSLQPDGVCGHCHRPHHRPGDRQRGPSDPREDVDIFEHPEYRSIGIIGDRTGAGPQIFAADEAVKATNCEIVKIELPRDTEGGAGHGSLIIFGAEDVSDARRAVEVCLREVDRTMGDVYGSPAGHLEFQYTARASHALNKAFGAPIGKAFGITVGAPAAIGVLLADTAVKAATVDVVGYSSPSNGGTSFSNEVILTFTGDSGAIQAGHHRRPRCGHAGAEDP